MSEVQSRPAAPRGRGSARGGRGGFSRGGRGGRTHATNGEKIDTALASIEDESEVGQLKKQYGSKVAIIKEMFPDWTDEDVVFALQETDGDLETTVERITDGSISQWGEVSKIKKDRSRSKVKDATVTSSVDTINQSRASRGGRAGFDVARGGRGRGTDRSRGGRGRGGSITHTNGTRSKENFDYSAPTSDLASWDTPKPHDLPTKDISDASKATDDSWGVAAPQAMTATVSSAAKVQSSIIPEGVQKTWATLFAPPLVLKKAPTPVEKPIEVMNTKEPTERPTVEPVLEAEPEEPEVNTTVETAVLQEPEPIVAPSKDELTEDNLEQVPDTSITPQTDTAASTAASSWDPRNGTNTSTPYSALQQSQQQAIRPPTSGFQASALKATGTSVRTPSHHQRRVLDQEEAVRMPGNREVDRAAVQFGAFNLNGGGDEDVDGDREETETRAQPPQHSPVAPRAALPPVPSQTAPVSESFPTPKQSAGLPAASLLTAAPGLPSPAPLTNAQGVSQQVPQGNGQYAQYGRYGQAGAPEQPSLSQKPYDAFSQQAPSAQSSFEGYSNQQSQSQTQPQTQTAAFSSAPNEYSSYYTADPQQRNAYNSYYQQQFTSQQHGAQAQDGAVSQQRLYSGYHGPQGDNSTQFPQSTAQQTQSRYATAGEGQNSGHSTPNPTTQAQQPGAATQGVQPQAAQQQQPHVPGSYPYGHPYYSSPYYTAYMNQYPGYGAGNYSGGPYGAKAGIHQQYQAFGMSPGAPYEHSPSPAAAGFGASSLHGRDSALGGLSDYGRAGSVQSAQTPQALGGSAAFGAGHDAFGRGAAYQGQSQQHYGGQQGSQQSADDLKPFGDSKTANGPSPSLQGGRPGSATNTAPSSALPPPQSQQAGYGGYPAHLQQAHGLHGSQGASQYGALGGVGGQHQAGGQGHQNSQYGGGYQGFGAGNYYGNSQQQQRGGWGGNYGH